MRPRRALVTIVAVVQTVLAGLLIAGHGPWSGRVLLALDETHGVDSGDVPVVALWLIGMLCCAALWRRVD